MDIPGLPARRAALEDQRYAGRVREDEAEDEDEGGEGEAAKVVALAGAEADRITKTGLATAETIEKQAAASGGAKPRAIAPFRVTVGMGR